MRTFNRSTAAALSTAASAALSSLTSSSSASSAISNRPFHAGASTTSTATYHNMSGAVQLGGTGKFGGGTVDAGPGFAMWQSIAIGTLLSLLILFCVVGNFFVILAIVLERDLRSRPQYYLIFSLAIADLMVGLIVTPLGAWMTLRQAWELGVMACDFWISVDVLVCTASILHLVAIALDRYWSITDITYSANRTPKRICVMIGVIWVVSLLISLAPIFGWKDSEFVSRVRKQHTCLISQAISYQVFSTATAFYIPLCAIILIYYKIMRAAKKRFKRERDRRTLNRNFDDATKAKVVAQMTAMPPSPCSAVAAMMPPLDICYNNTTGNPTTITTTTAAPTTVVGNNNLCPSAAPENGHFNKMVKIKYESTGNSTSDDERTPMQIQLSECPTTNAPSTMDETTFVNKVHNKEKVLSSAKKQLTSRTASAKRKKRESVEMRRERKAWRTLAIITGTFVACWTPFFLVSLYRPICNCHIPPVLESVTAWLGYLNSALNPVIYTVFSLDFRAAFQRILKRICFIKEF